MLGSMTMHARQAALVAGLVVLLALASAQPTGALVQHHSTFLDTLQSEPIDQVPTTVHENLTGLETDSASSALIRLGALYGLGFQSLSASPSTPPWMDSAPLALRTPLSILWGGLLAARQEYNVAVQNLTASEMNTLLGNESAALDASTNISSGFGTPDDWSVVNGTQNLALKVDSVHFGTAELYLLNAYAAASPFLRNVVGLADLPSPTCASGSVVFETADCLVVVGGYGSTTYATDTTLQVDLGGTDTYRNNAGGAALTIPPGQVDVSIDLGPDTDTYNATNIAPAVQGAGCNGVGLLIDEGGDNTYRANNLGGCNKKGNWEGAQGSAVTGAGVLWNRGIGSNLYSAPPHAQGYGSTGGIGMLLDEGGSDRYDATPIQSNPKGAQGTGCIGGVGALVDQGTGDDVYVAYMADNQGMGCLAGLGVLVDAGGNDTYTIIPAGGIINGGPDTISGYGQGFGEAGGVGMLIDESGNDVYAVNVISSSPYEGWRSQGASSGDLTTGVLGILEDVAGNDQYFASNRTQGFGQDARAVLADMSGSDVYSARYMCQGTALGAGEALLLDLGGSADSYVCLEPVAGAGVRADNHAWHSGSGLSAGVPTGKDT